jgi:hypothetical protein
VGAPLDCVGTGADPAPGIGPGAGRLVAGSIGSPESAESNSLALRLPTAARGAVCKERRDLFFGDRGALARSFRLGGRLVLSPPSVLEDVPPQLPQRSRGQLR